MDKLKIAIAELKPFLPGFAVAAALVIVPLLVGLTERQSLLLYVD
jgi:hypothetical protein